MIDIESDVFDFVSDELRLQYPGIFVSGEVTDRPSTFPAVTIVQEGNSVIERMRTENIENVVRVMFEVNVYSNLARGKKQQAKEITALIDKQFSKMNFTRTMCSPMSNLQDATIYRIVSRYVADVDRDLWIYYA